MMTYKDKTFCSSSQNRCVNCYCERYLSKKVMEDAQHWWGGKNVPIAMADFWDQCAKRHYHRGGVLVREDAE